MPNEAPSAAIQAIWQRQLPQTQERVAYLRHAADALAESRTIEPEMRSEAREIAHKLAGSLGMFGYHDATEAARAVEQELEHTGLPQPERLQQHVSALEAAVAEALQTS